MFYRTVIYIVTHNGYFREYLIGTTKSNESSWLLEREFNLLDAYSGSPKQNELHID
jgi:autophagy-related protein 18